MDHPSVLGAFALSTGLPPFLPFTLAAAAFASDLVSPPSLPRCAIQGLLPNTPWTNRGTLNCTFSLSQLKALPVGKILISDNSSCEASSSPCSHSGGKL